jgi:hypothetical protein
MRRAGIKILVIGLTALGLSAGVVAGMLVSRLPAAMSGAGQQTALPTSAVSSSLAQELNLTPQQQEQMRQIWENVRGQVQDCFSQAQDLQKQRDDEIIKLLNDDQKAKFEEISKRFHARDVKIKDDREQILAVAISKTKQLLNDEQRKKYDQILARRLGKVPTTGPVAEVIGLFEPACIENPYGDAWGDSSTLGGTHD